MHSRDTLLALLWPEANQRQGRHALRNVLHALRKAVGSEALATQGDALVGVMPEGICCDALDAEAHLARKEWAQALALYQGDLLAGFHVSEAPEFEEWLAGERNRFREMMVGAAGSLAAALQAEGDLAGAIRAAERRTRLAPLEEAGHRQLVTLLLAHGERARAMSIFQRLEERLRAEVGAELSAETRSLRGRLADTGLRAGSAEPSHAQPAPVSAAAPLPFLSAPPDQPGPLGSSSLPAARASGAPATSPSRTWRVLLAAALLIFLITVTQRFATSRTTTSVASPVTPPSVTGATDAAARRYYLEGAYIWDRRFEARDMQLARARFDSALMRDPVYVDALAGRARIWFALGWSGFEPTAQHLAAARGDAVRALELDSTNRTALSTLGALLAVEDSARARQLLARAMALDSTRPDTWYLEGLRLGFQGNYHAAEVALRRAVKLDPLTPYAWYTLAGTQVCQGSLDSALATVERWLAAPTRPELVARFEVQRGWILLALGRWKEAIPLLQGGFAAGSPRAIAALGDASSLEQVWAAVRTEAQRQVRVDSSANRSRWSPRARASLTMLSGNTAGARGLLDEAQAGGDPGARLACVDPMLGAPGMPTPARRTRSGN